MRRTSFPKPSDLKSLAREFEEIVRESDLKRADFFEFAKAKYPDKGMSRWDTLDLPGPMLFDPARIEACIAYLRLRKVPRSRVASFKYKLFTHLYARRLLPEIYGPGSPLWTRLGWLYFPKHLGESMNFTDEVERWREQSINGDSKQYRHAATVYEQLEGSGAFHEETPQIVKEIATVAISYGDYAQANDFSERGIAYLSERSSLEPSEVELLFDLHRTRLNAKGHLVLGSDPTSISNEFRNLLLRAQGLNIAYRNKQELLIRIHRTHIRWLTRIFMQYYGRADVTILQIPRYKKEVENFRKALEDAPASISSNGLEWDTLARAYATVGHDSMLAQKYWNEGWRRLANWIEEKRRCPHLRLDRYRLYEYWTLTSRALINGWQAWSIEDREERRQMLELAFESLDVMRRAIGEEDMRHSRITYLGVRSLLRWIAMGASSAAIAKHNLDDAKYWSDFMSRIEVPIALDKGRASHVSMSDQEWNQFVWGNAMRSAHSIQRRWLCPYEV